MRTIATLSDIYGSDSGPTFFNSINGSAPGMQGTNQTSTGAPDMAGGGGTTTAAAINPVPVLSNIQGTLWGSGVFQLMIIIVTIIGIYALAKRHVPNLESDLSVPRVSLSSFWSIGAQAFVFLVIVKTLLKKYSIPGLSGLAAAA